MSDPMVSVIRALEGSADAESVIQVGFRSVDESCRRRAAAAAVRGLREGTEQGKRFGALVNSFFSLDGFRKAAAAPDAVLGQAVALALASGAEEQLCRSVLAIWMCQRPHAVLAVSKWLRASRLRVGELNAKHVEAIRAFLASEDDGGQEGNTGGIDECDGVLAIIAIRAAGSTPDTQDGSDPVEPVNGENESPWEQCLEILDATEPESSAWDDVEQFLDQVRTLASTKVQARQAHRREVSEVIEAIRATHTDALGFLEIDTSSWTSDHLATDAAPEALRELEAFRETLKLFEPLLGQQARTFHEQRRNGEEMSRLAALAADSRDRLAVLLVPPASEGRAETAIEKDSAPEISIEAEPQVPMEAELPAAGGGTLVDETLPGTESSTFTAAPADRTVEPPAAEPPQQTPTESVEVVDVQGSVSSPDFARAVSAIDISAEPDAIREDVSPALAEEELPSAPTELSVAALIPRQRDWLIRRRLLAATIAGAWLEEHGRMTQDQERTYTPHWLCQFALLMDDPGTAAWPFEPAELIAFHAGLDQEPIERQRTFLGWLCAGLIGEGAHRALQVARTVDVRLIAGHWLGDSALHQFCTASLLEPARNGQLPRFATGHSIADLNVERTAQLKAAEAITTRSSNYKNRFVIRYWMDMVGPGGPVQKLLARASAGTPIELLPTSEDLAGSVRGWHDVLSTYRSNILNRLDDFLDHLKQVAIVDERLRLFHGQSSSMISVDRAVQAVAEARAQASRLFEQGCPSAGAFSAISDSLTGMLKRKSA